MWQRLLKVSLPVGIFSITIFAIMGFNELRHTIITLLNLQGIGFVVDTSIFDAGKFLSHTWFVTVILMCYLITPSLYKLSQNNRLTNKNISFIWLMCFMLDYFHVHLGNIALYVTAFYIAANNKLGRYSVFYLFMCSIFAVGLRIIGRSQFDGSIFYNNIICSISHTLLAASIMILIREAFLRTDRFYIFVNSSVYKFIEKYSFYIYITHYCLLTYTYCIYDIGVASILFLSATFILCVTLQRTHYYAQKGISIILSKSNCAKSY